MQNYTRKYKKTDRKLVFKKEANKSIANISDDRLQYLLELMNTF
jgi:hypothetical protein